MVEAFDRLQLALYRADIERVQRRARKLAKARKGLGMVLVEEPTSLTTRKDLSWDRDDRRYSSRYCQGRKPRTFRDMR